MKKQMFASTLLFLMLGFHTLPVVFAATLVRFEGGIGVIPVRGNAPPFTANVIQGVNPAGQPWVIRHLVAHVTTSGEIRVKGHGLIRAGGNIGTTSDDPVFATLFCGDVAHHTHAVSPDPDGDFRIDDVLDPAPPDPCARPILLIRNVNTGQWFAAGIPRE